MSEIDSMQRRFMEARRLQDLRKAGKVSRQELAAELGKSYSYIQRVEEGHVEVNREASRAWHAAVTAITGRRREAVKAVAAQA